MLEVQPTTPIIVRIPEPPTRETNAADVLIQAIGLTGVFVLAAIFAGLLIGGLFIWLKRLRPDNPLGGKSSQRLDLYSPPR